MSLWTDIRDAVESVAVVVGNYYLPGSSILTSKLVSEGSQEQLSSDLGILAQLTSGIAGAAQGNMSNYGKIFGGSGGSTAGSPGSGLATDNTGAQSVASANATPLVGASADVSAYTNPGIINNTSANVLSATPPTTNGQPGIWDKIGTFLDKPGNVAAVGLGLQGTGAIMAGMGAAEKAKVEKEKQDYERAQNERQLANINAPWVNPVQVNKRPGIINSRSIA